MIGVSTQASSAKAALEANNAKSTALLNLLKANGIAAKDLQTRQLSINPTYNDKSATISGYQVDNMVQATSRNIALYLQHAPGVVRINGDPVQLQQVILNLVVNSMDAMTAIPYGRTVIGRIELNGGSTAEISISDSGPGIPPDKLAQVFDPFFTTKEKGMGIGLSIARTIILAHKGRIWAENQSGGGAAFHFVLPLAA
jgi:signal transduction histidine kinase